MHKLTSIIFFALTFQCHSQETIPNPGLKALIDSLYQVDQQVQQDMVTAIQKGLLFDSLKVLETVEKQTFARHIPLLKDIYKRYGYPTAKLVGQESSYHFFTLVQHSDADVNFQSKMLPLIKKQVDKKQASGKEYAFLYDRIHLNRGGEQLYGTQLDYDSNGNAFPKRLKDSANVNKRRQQLGMEAIEEYLAKVTEMHKQMNKRN